MKIIEFLFKNIEKILRYLVPAFVLIMSLKHFDFASYKKYFPSDDMHFVLFFAIAGVTIYSVHRTLFEAVDYCIIKCFKCICKTTSVTETVAATIIMDDKEKSYLYYKSAIIHSSLLASEIVVIFSYCYNKTVWFWFAISIWTISLMVYIGYHKITKDIPTKLKELKDINKQPTDTTQ